MTHSKHRTPEEWQSIIDDFNHSGYSGAKYCRMTGTSYASFCKWRQKFNRKDIPVDEVKAEHTQQVSTDFIDLSSQLNSADQAVGGWNIRLRLGGGIELVLNQASC